MGGQQDSKHVCRRCTKQALALTALEGHTFSLEQNLLLMQKEENGVVRNVNNQENVSYPILANCVY